MRYSATIISRGKSYDNEVIGEFAKLIESIDGLIFHSIQVLSPDKATDFIVQLQESTDEKEFISRAREAIREFNSSYNAKSLEEKKVDIIFQLNGPGRSQKKLFIFDMDSTLITQEVIELIAAYANAEDEVRDITEAAMRGELDFNQSLAQRVALLKGIESAKLWDELQKKLILTNGAVELTRGLKKLDIKLGVLSGGFIPLANYLKTKLNLDYAYANNLKVTIDPQLKKEILSGETFGEIVNGEKKAELLKRIADENDINVENAVAVGDGANDLKMMGVAGWGIAWNAKPKVQLEAPSALNSNSLKDIFYILGFNDTYIEKLLRD